MATTTANLGLIKQASNEYADIDIINSNLDLIDSFVGAKAAKSTSVSAMLTASGWAGTSTPYTQSVSITGLGSAANGLVNISQSANATQRSLAYAARLSVFGQSANLLTIVADGTKPSGDIPITVLILG